MYGVNDYNDDFYNKTKSDKSYTSVDDCLNDSLTNEHHAIINIDRPKKRQRTINASPIVFAQIRIKKGSKKTRMIKVLLDLGGSGTIIKHDIVKDLWIKQDDKTVWTTTAGNFSTTGRTVVDFQLPELQSQTMIHKTVHVTTKPMNYDMIIGQDLLEELGIDLSFQLKRLFGNIVKYL